jgi:hypothetical protein
MTRGARRVASASRGAMPRAARERRAKDQIVGKLRGADPLELIRWLARSQQASARSAARAGGPVAN